MTKERSGDLYYFIDTSYDRAAGEIILSRDKWINVLWGVHWWMCKKHRGARYKIDPFSVKYYDNFNHGTPDESLFDMSEPLEGREEEIQEFLDPWWDRHPALYGTQVLGVTYTTVIVNPQNAERWFIWKKDFRSAAQALADRYNIPTVRFRVER